MELLLSGRAAAEAKTGWMLREDDLGRPLSPALVFTQSGVYIDWKIQATGLML